MGAKEPRLLLRFARSRFGFDVVLVVLHRDAIAFGRPPAEIDHPTALRTEWAMTVGRTPLDGFAALRTIDDARAHVPTAGFRDYRRSTRNLHPARIPWGPARNPA